MTVETVGAPASSAGGTDTGAPASDTRSRFRRIQRGRWHSYELDGQRLPTVTGLIRDGIPKPNLIDWAARIAGEYAADNIDQIARLERDAAVDLIKTAHRRTTSSAAAKGTDIHRLAEQLADGQAVEVPEATAGYVDAYVVFLQDWQPEFIALEAPVVNRRWRYAGTFDICARLQHIGAVVIDVKTGGSGVWPETCLQVAAYRAAEIYLDAHGVEQPMTQTVAGYALWLGDDGSYELLPVESGPDIFAVFLHVAHVAAFMNRAKDDLIGLPLAAPMSLVQFPRSQPVEVDRVRSVVELMPAYIDLASRIANTEFVPGALRRRPEAVLAALMSGAERGLGPLESLRSVHVIDGRPSLSAEAMRALVFAAGHTIEIVESSATRATVIGRRAGSESTSPPFTWTLDRARRARLAGKQNWQTYPEAMLLARASAELCRAVFPDVIAGLVAVEELEDETAPEPATTTRQAPRRRRLAPPPPAPIQPAGAPDATSAVEIPQPMSPADLGGIPGADEPSWAAGSANREPDQPADPAIARRIHAELAQAFPAEKGATRDRWRHALVAVVTRRRPDGPATSSTGVSLEEQLALSKLVTNITAGQASVADGPDNTIEVRVAGGWRYTITLDPVAVTVGRGDQPAGETSGGASPDTGEASSPPAAEASPDQLELHDTPDE